ncbi:pseudouridine synthase DEG1 [Aspergillus clavatus NRRL 1]|uniref:Pseudouridylate synthase 3 n=1 Tax=Aspergillus clavatus (strain ATCC 1007 / CBS 513.65 / DSM 816 / NCTC 3887 / NRRL 1 / QM 1276 / 107) TaxID=344612 RepID=A1CL65_ASPCL|nr:pseudouridylate synthase 3 [Aspergillus clavatus NRRL 1]EAW09889.1 pseudouridylate synthase 3 [Aspergillus clavatus NRRL 1]
MPDTAEAPHGSQPDYSTWTTSSLIARITDLERQLHSRTTEYTTPPSSKGVTDPRATSANPPPSDAVTNKIPAKTKQKRPLSPGDDITHTRSPTRPPKQPREIDPSKYNTRFIALKFAYLGQRYNGLEHANGNVTPLPTIEEEIWKAMRRTRLIFPTDAEPFDDSRGPRALKPYSLSWEGCDYSKAGRTDRGVSAFGQVIGIRVRSARPKRPATEVTSDVDMTGLDAPAEDTWDDIADEIPYISMLNRVLPEDIRILAWCPQPPPGFDARFSCRERQYKYFFTQPAFSPTPGPLGLALQAVDSANKIPAKYREGWLDIDAMREAAKHFEGVHDFRNFCKLDTSKQIENFERIIYHADIELVDPKHHPLGYVNQPGFQASENSVVGADTVAQATAAQVYVFNLHGSAFLWHQVRHMVSILFLVGQGLESPSIVAELLDVSKNPRKPTYEMASDAPLVLWNCIFPDESNDSRKDALDWVYAGDPRQSKSQLGKGSGKFGVGGVVDALWSVWRQRKMDEVLAGALLDLAVSQGDQSIVKGDGSSNPVSEKQGRGQKVFYGANEPRMGGKYVPVMQKRKTDPVEVQNARWLASKQRKIERAPEPTHGDD